MSSSASSPSSYYPQFLESASKCANSDTCSIDDAEMYLREIFHAQSGCAAGTVSGTEICEDVIVISEIVSNLRNKIRIGTGREEVGTFRDRPRSPHPAYLAFAALYSIAFVSALGQFQDAGATNIAPFAAHEVWWAMRDGYVGDLIAHAFRNGGLLVGDVDYYVASAGHHAAGISPLELFWSVRDGYAGNTILSSSTGVFGGVDGDGGMLVDGSNVVTLSPREIWWAIKDGYAYDMIEHWLRNGGLLV